MEHPTDSGRKGNVQQWMGVGLWRDCEGTVNGPSVPCQWRSTKHEEAKRRKRKGTPRNKLTMQRPRFALTVFQGGGDGDPIRQRVYPLRGGVSIEVFFVV